MGLSTGPGILPEPRQQPFLDRKDIPTWEELSAAERVPPRSPDSESLATHLFPWGRLCPRGCLFLRASPGMGTLLTPVLSPTREARPPASWNSGRGMCMRIQQPPWLLWGPGLGRCPQRSLCWAPTPPPRSQGAAWLGLSSPVQTHKHQIECLTFTYVHTYCWGQSSHIALSAVGLQLFIDTRIQHITSGTGSQAVVEEGYSGSTQGSDQ